MSHPRKTSSPTLTLSALRKRLGRSQAEVATAIGTTQSGVSRIEYQSDLRVSTLSEYVNALGGHLRLVVEHGTGDLDIVIRSLRQYASDRSREFRVIWQDKETRRFVHVGWLQFTGQQYVFSYTDEARSHARFQPFPMLPVYDKSYRSKDLFPFFAIRLTSTADPQYDAVLNAVGLTRGGATPAELLARCPTESPHDTIQVIPEPTEMSDGTLLRLFLVSGISHADQQDPQVSRHISNLTEGSLLRVVPEPHNPEDPNALQLVADDKPVGWVPNYLLNEIHRYINSNRSISFAVARANGPGVPWHLRLLCRMTVAPHHSDTACKTPTADPPAKAKAARI